MDKQTTRILLGGIFSLMVAMGIGRFAYTPLLPHMQSGLHFSDAVAGYLATSNYGGYLLGALLAGVLPLKNQRKLFLKISLVISVLTTFAMGLTHSFALMHLLRFTAGVSSAFIFVLASSIVLDSLAATGKANWSGLFYSGVGWGIFLTGLIIPGLNRQFHWEGTWIGLAIVAAVLALFSSRWLKGSPRVVQKIDHDKKITNLPSRSWLPLLMIAYGLEGLGYIVTGTFIISYGAHAFEFNGDPTFLWMIVGLAAIPSCIVWSLFAKRWGFIPALVIALALQSLGIALPVLMQTPESFIISAILFGATFMGITTLATTFARQISPTNSSRIIAYLTTIYAIGQMIGPAAAGKLAHITDSFDVALIGAAGAVLLGSFTLLGGMSVIGRSNKTKIEVR